MFNDILGISYKAAVGTGGETGVTVWNTLKAIMDVNGDQGVTNEEFVNYIKNMTGVDLSHKLTDEYDPYWEWDKDPYVLIYALSGVFETNESDKNNSQLDDAEITTLLKALLGDDIDADWANEILKVYDLDSNGVLDVYEQGDFWEDVKADGGILNSVLGGDAPDNGGDDGTGGDDGSSTAHLAWNGLKALMDLNDDQNVSFWEVLDFI